MAIALQPNRSTEGKREKAADAFIAEAGKRNEQEDGDVTRKPVMLRIPEDFLKRVDAAAKRNGTNRTAFIMNAIAAQLNRENL